MLAEVRAIGRLSSIQVDKSDKTNEYKDLAARRASREKARDALTALRAQTGARLEDLIALQNKILEIEEAIQEMGVKLGEFDAENEFVTIHFTLLEERAPASHHVSVAHRIRVAFVWAVEAYAIILGLLLLAGLGVLIAIAVLERLRVIPELGRKPVE
jgi:hypothetical protein